MCSHCGTYDMDNDGIERVDFQRWDVLVIGVLEELHQRKKCVLLLEFGILRR